MYLRPLKEGLRLEQFKEASAEEVMVCSVATL